MGHEFGWALSGKGERRWGSVGRSGRKRADGRVVLKWVGENELD